MKDYTPTTEDVRDAYIGEPGRYLNPESMAREFDRWLASVIEEAEARGREQVWSED